MPRCTLIHRACAARQLSHHITSPAAYQSKSTAAVVAAAAAQAMSSTHRSGQRKHCATRARYDSSTSRHHTRVCFLTRGSPHMRPHAGCCKDQQPGAHAHSYVSQMQQPASQQPTHLLFQVWVCPLHLQQGCVADQLIALCPALLLHWRAAHWRAEFGAAEQELVSSGISRMKGPWRQEPTDKCKGMIGRCRKGILGAARR